MTTHFAERPQTLREEEFEVALSASPAQIFVAARKVLKWHEH